MACGGLKFVENELSSATKKLNATQRSVNLARDMMKFVEGFTYNNGRKLILKIGIHTGQCIFGILGYHKPQFSLIGDTVNTTSRHCTTGERGSIILSQEAQEAVVNAKFGSGKYNFDERYA